MRRRRQHGLGEDAVHRRVRALAGRAAGAVGDRDEVRCERREPRRSPPTASAPSPPSSAGRIRTRRGSAPFGAGSAKRLVAGIAHHATSRLAGAAPARCADRARARATPRSCLPARRGSVCCGNDVEAGRLRAIASPSRRRSRAGDGRAPRAGIRDRAARNRPPEAGRPAAARAPPRGWRARCRRGSAAPDG